MDYSKYIIRESLWLLILSRHIHQECCLIEMSY